jgi:hypothetical protein
MMDLLDTPDKDLPLRDDIRHLRRILDDTAGSFAPIGSVCRDVRPPEGTICAIGFKFP